MENNLVPEFVGDLPKKNTKQYPLVRATLRYGLIFIAAFVAGILFCRATESAFKPDGAVFERITSHFTDVFWGCSSCKDYFTVIVSASAVDIRYLLLIFAAGFTYFCNVATSAFILCRGFTIGFSLQYLVNVSASGLLNLTHPNAATVIFAVTELTLAAFMIWLGAKSLVFAYDFRRLRGRRSQIVRSPVIYRYLLLYLTAFGLILIINSVSCLLSILVYR